MRRIASLQCFLVLAFVLFGAEREPAFGTFSAHLQQYLTLRKSVEASLPHLKPTKEASQIALRRHELARKIAQTRSGARQGEIFTTEVAKQFREIIRLEFNGPTAAQARKTIRPDEPSKPVVPLRVNAEYPEDMPLTTMPPTLLSKLPQLPQELEYRIVAHDFVLLDTKAGLIVDLIPNTIP